MLTRPFNDADVHDPRVNAVAVRAWRRVVQRQRPHVAVPCRHCRDLDVERCACARDRFICRFLASYPPVDADAIHALVRARATALDATDAAALARDILDFAYAELRRRQWIAWSNTYAFTR